ncbi:MAG: GIY-YIG nuclease family protein [Nonlabens sp.]
MHLWLRYILYSVSIDRFYSGSCRDFKERLEQHKSGFFTNSYTAKAGDWEVHLEIQNLGYEQARMMELHIKRMKSKISFENLRNYPEMVERLKQKYAQG